MASDHCMRGGAPETLIWGGRAEALSTAAESFGGGGAMPLGVPVFDNVLKALEIRTSDDGAGLEVELGAEAIAELLGACVGSPSPDANP